MTAVEDLASGPPLDLLVVGGGVNGAGVAREAAIAGLRVALLEAGDFGFGTTWRSTKLIHGGLRYLEHGDVRLVRESLRERGRLLRERPWLVRPLRFVLPQLPWSRRHGWQLRIGLAAYDLLAGRSGLPRHRRVSAARARELIPGLAPEMAGAFTFFDARARAPERLAVELALEARQAGAAVINHAAVVGLGVVSGRVVSATVERAGGTVDVPTKAVVNAAGPWVDEVAALVGELPPVLDLTRGTHLVLDLPEHRLGAAVISTAKSDGRVLFVIPQGRTVLVGTTDDRYSGAPGDVRPMPVDIEYLLDEARALVPGEPVDAARGYAYAGLRPLSLGRMGSEEGVSRRHHVILHEELGGPAGLMSITGGKLSTYREVAAQVLHALGTVPGHGPLAAFDESGWREMVASLPGDRDARVRLSTYGPRLAEVIRLGPDPVCTVCGLLEGEVRHALRHEAAEHLTDVLAGRAGTAWTRERGLCCLEIAARVAADEVGWSHWEGMREIEGYRALVGFHLPTLEAVRAEGTGLPQ